jgi:NAD(P)H-dependent flavin oxidoreductase YrpB (nitropropane dioxygenase family)
MRGEAVQLRRYAQYCGWALARAHANTGDPAAIAGYLGRNDQFDKALARFAVSYADQNERDHVTLVEAVKSGRLEVIEEN